MSPVPPDSIHANAMPPHSVGADVIVSAHHTRSMPVALAECSRRKRTDQHGQHHNSDYSSFHYLHHITISHSPRVKLSAWLHSRIKNVSTRASTNVAHRCW